MTGQNTIPAGAIARAAAAMVQERAKGLPQAKWVRVLDVLSDEYRLEALAEAMAALDAAGFGELLTALREIAKGEGAFSTDQLEHAENTIDNMRDIAKAAAAQAERP